MLNETQQNQLAKAWITGIGWCGLILLIIEALLFSPWLITAFVAFITIPAIPVLIYNRIKKGTWLAW